MALQEKQYSINSILLIHNEDPMFRFLHAADIHLDSPLRGLEAYPDAPLDQIRNAARRALTGIALSPVCMATKVARSRAVHSHSRFCRVDSGPS